MRHHGSSGLLAVGLTLFVLVIVPVAGASSTAHSISSGSASATASVSTRDPSLPAGPGAFVSPVPPSVGQTSVLINNTVYQGLYRSVDTADSGRYPDYWGTTPAYDPSTNLFYEPVYNVTLNSTAVYNGGYLAAISPATDSMVELIPVGLIPEGVAYDSSNHLLYVVNYDSNNISIVSPTTNSVVGSLGLPHDSSPDGSIAVNNSSGHLFLASPANGEVWDVNISNDQNVSITTSESSTAAYVVYDNQTGEVYQADSAVQVIGPNNDTVWKTISLPASEDNPGAPVVDWWTDELYVPWGNSTSAIELSTNTLGPTLLLSPLEGVAPGAAFDPANGMVYVLTDYQNYNVTELDPATHRWVASSPAIPSAEYGGIAYSTGSGRLLIAGNVQDGSSGFVLMSPGAGLPILGQPVTAVYPGLNYFDPLTGHLFVTTPGIGPFGNVTAIDPATGKILGYVPAGSDPVNVWVDPSTGFGYIANFGPPAAGHVDNLTVFNARTLVATGSIPVGAEPYAMTYDPVTGDLYVSNSESTNITVIDPATNSSVGSISTPGFGATVLLYVPTTSLLYAVGPVGGEPYGLLQTISPSEMKVVTYAETYFQPGGAAYDAATGLIYVQDTNSSVYVLQEFDPETGGIVGSINLYEATGHMAWDPVNDLLYVPAGLNYTNGGYDANWVIEVNVTSGQLVNLTVGEEPSGISVNSSSGEAFVSDTDSGSVVFLEPGTPAPSTGYTVTFETVPSSCTVTFDGVSYPDGTEASGVAAGTYPLVANVCSGESFSSWSSTAGSVASPTAASTTLTVSASGTVTGTYAAVTTGYTVNFQVYPSTCSITFGGTSYTNGQQVTGVAGGSYPLLANACTGETFSAWSSTAGTLGSTSADSTSVLVSSSGIVNGTFTATPPGTYLVSFVETGLPTGTSWSITLAGTPLTQSSATISSAEADGTYDYTVGTVEGYTSNVTSGSVVVSGSDQIVYIGFSAASSSPHGSSSPGGLTDTDLALIGGLILASLILIFFFLVARPHRYPLVFTQSGLPAETTWSVTVDGALQTSSAVAIEFQVAVGTHSFEVGPVTGYDRNPSAGSIEMSKDRRMVPVAFSRPKP
jgi:DNA-binding beta-propeller fold protein YncE